ncbi:MAG: hypothetical protein J1E81_05165 [Eubacterium sp.]|nr:hypothetical protein [Eubacterium sp.]
MGSILGAITVENVFSSLKTVFELVMDQFSTTVTTITSNPLLFVPVLCGFGGGLILIGVKVMRRFGVKGMSSGKRRRR